MITEKTITTWLADFTAVGKDDKTGLMAMESVTLRQSKFIASEPIFVAMLATLMNVLKFENSLSAVIYVLGAYHDCKRRQDEADELSKDMQ